MKSLFRDRTEAGQLLAKRLSHYANRKDALVLGLPRGGVPVAFEVATRLHLPLEVFVVRKLGLPGSPELAMGAIATGGVRVLNQEVVDGLCISPLTIDSVAAEELKELGRREMLYRGRAAAPVLKAKVITVVDDGIATGSTMLAGVKTIKMQRPARVVVAVPTAAALSCEVLSRQVDEFIALMTPKNFETVGQWYEDFSQVSDVEVIRFLRKAASASTAGNPKENSSPLKQIL